MRSPLQYEFTFNAQSKKYLTKASYYIDNTQKGIYLKNTGILPWLFAYCERSIELSITTENTPEEALDKIIVLL